MSDHILTADYIPSFEGEKFHKTPHRFRFVVWGIKSGKCLEADQGVLLPNGETKLAKDIKVGDKVVGYEDYGIKETKVTGVEKTREICLKVTLRDGTSLSCSVDHKFPCWDAEAMEARVAPLCEIIEQRLEFVRPYGDMFGKRTEKFLFWDYLGERDCYHIEVGLHTHQFLLDNCIVTQNSHMGAMECVRFALAMEGALIWCVAPTYQHLQVAWREVMNVLSLWEGLLVGYNKNAHEIRLCHGGLIQFRSADFPDGLRGPNVDAMWVDEGAFMKPDAWYICKERVAATGGEIWVTTTPHGRNWLWTEANQGGMPANAPYGEFSTEDRWVSHYPTWHFPWAAKKDVIDAMKTMPRDVFEQEFGAMFRSSGNTVFRGIEECCSYLPYKKPDPGMSTVIGVDLARHKDFNAVVVMNADGEVCHVDYWNDTNWAITRPRLKKIAEKWNGILIVDSSNIGSVIEEDLRADGVRVYPVNLHSPQKKTEIVHALQIAIEGQQIKIRDPRAKGAGSGERKLFDELQIYSYVLTSTGRASYAAPKGLHDDMVMALALAQFARQGGQAGGASHVFQVMSPRADWKPKISNPANLARKNMNKSVFKPRTTIYGLDSPGGTFWER